MNNQATVPITTANNNTLVARDSPSAINMTASSSASSMVSINPAPVISVDATGGDLNFETRLNAMENAIVKLESTLEKFISTNNPSGKSRGKNDRENVTEFLVKAS